MDKGRIGKLAAFNGLLLLANVAVFSQAFLGVRLFGQGALQSAVGFAFLTVSVALFFYVNLQILNTPKKKIMPGKSMEKLTTLESCREAIQGMEHSDTFSPKMNRILDQIDKLQKKRSLISDILLQKFTDTEMSYQKFKTIVDSAESVMHLNVRSILNRIYAFDEEEYAELVNGRSGLRSKSLLNRS